MAIVIFGDSFSFPEGNAATNRVHTYAKGFYENGINVHVISFGSRYNNAGKGMIDGIYFYHPFSQKKRSKYFIIRRWHNLKKYFNVISIFKDINKNEKIIATICYTQLLKTLTIAFILSKIIKFKTILERGEHPLQYYQNSFFRKIEGDIKIYLEIKLCNGITCISQYLIDFYNKRGVNDKKLFLVPSTVDTNRFLISNNALFPFQYILYCGSLTLVKDGLHILIESFVRISEKYPKINLVIIGKGITIEEEIKIKGLVSSLNIVKRVFFLGQLSRMEIPAYLNSAKILALARPKSMVADAGFPSKLTEYLASGIPLVVTEVGEIPVYLKDNENAFISQPDSVDDFTAKLDFVLSNYKLAKQVAIKGKELTKTIFNYSYQAKRIISFINSI